MDALEIQQCSSLERTNSIWPNTDLMDERDFFLEDEVITHAEPMVSQVQEVTKKRWVSLINIGKVSVLALVAVIASQGGLLWERHRLSLDSKQQGAQTSRGESGADSIGPLTLDHGTSVSDPGVLFTVSLSWLPESSSGLRFSVPVAKLETVDVVQELMDINMEVNETSQTYSQIKPSGQYSRSYDTLWSDLDPEMLQIVAQISFPEAFSMVMGEKTNAMINKDPFSQEELVNLVAVR